VSGSAEDDLGPVLTWTNTGLTGITQRFYRTANTPKLRIAPLMEIVNNFFFPFVRDFAYMY
jgi:hypothetical protein